jgi:CRP/FNR family cyclic AMP-dependent transcriptional regulator
MDVEGLIERMRKLKHFTGLSVEEIKAIIDAGHISRYQAGGTLFLEGHPCAGLFVLLSGQVHLYKTGPKGQVTLIAVVNPVIMFNEVAVLDLGENTVTAITVQECDLWKITCKAFDAVIRQFPQVALGLLPVLAARNRTLIEQYEDLSFLSVEARTAKLLLTLSEFGRKDIDRCKNTIAEMAARISTSPEPLSRSISHFRDNGLITSSRTRIWVDEPETLAQKAHLNPNIFRNS